MLVARALYTNAGHLETIRNEQSGFYRMRTTTLFCSPESGIIGDAIGVPKHRTPWRQVLLRVCEEGDTPYLGENLRLSWRVPPKVLSIGDRLTFASGLVLVITSHRIPCFKINHVLKDNQAKAWYRDRDLSGAGFFARIDVDGSVSENDLVTHERAEVSLPVVDAARMAAGYAVSSICVPTLERLVENGTVDPAYAKALLTAPPMEEPKSCWYSVWLPSLAILVALAFDHFSRGGRLGTGVDVA